MSDRVSAKLYKIQDSVFGDYKNPEILITEIIRSYNERTGNELREIDLKEELDREKYNSKLFVYNTKSKEPTWFNFVESIASERSDIEDLRTKHSTFILFLYSEQSLFAVSKGYYGKYVLEDFIDSFFGLDVLSRLVNKTDTEIKQLEERGVFGIEIGAQRFFRNNFSLIHDDEFGKIYKTMLASIDEDDFSKVGIKKKREDTFSVTAYGSSSFEVSTNFDYEELLNRISCIETLLENEGVQFNQFYRVPNSELSRIKDNLNFELLNMAYESYTEGLTIDFYHPDVFNYLRSVELGFVVHGVAHEIPFGSSLNSIEIIKELTENGEIDNTSRENFINSLKECFGAFKLNDSDDYYNFKSLDKWIGGEVELNGEKFFKIDNEWYKYTDDFDGYLNNYFEEIDFSQITPINSLDSWESSIVREDEYNENYKDKENYILGDKVLINNLEICDLIKIIDGEIFLYHIKQGLGRDLRVLANQIINSSRLIINSIKENNYSQLKSYYQKLKRKHYLNSNIEITINNTLVNIDENTFVDLFTNSKIKYVFAYSSSSQSEMKDEIIATNSRIAKLSLLYCIRDMKRNDTELLVERIPVI